MAPSSLLQGQARPRAAPRRGPSPLGDDEPRAERDFVRQVRIAYAQLGMSRQTYATRYALPVAAGAAGATVFAWLLMLPSVPGWLQLPLGAAVPLLGAAAIALLPLVLRERRRNAIDHNIHFYITRAGVLAQANLSAIDILRRLCDRDAFGPLAEETERIVFLVQRWNMSLSGAMRAVSRGSPSAIYAEFLERFAYALDSGEELSHFLDSEQKVVMEDFATIYQGALYSIEALKDAFMSLAMSVVFLVVFGIVSPVLTGFRAEDFMVYALVFLGLIDGIFLILILNRAPRDPLWHPPAGGTTPRERVLRRSLAPACAASVALGALVLLTGALPMNLGLVLAMTPPVVVGTLVRREENQVRRRDDHYPAFVRALGSAASASGGVARQVLRRLRHHNFGPLSKPVDRLYRRLHLRVDDAASWRAFAAESGSHLVAKFNAMFVEGTRAGGEPEAIGRIISANYVRILNLRKHRKQTAQSFRGMLLGFMAGMAFTMYIGVGVLHVLVGLFSGLQGGADAVGVLSFSPGSAVDFATLTLLLQVALVTHAALGSMMTQAVEGGSFLGGYVDFVILLWLAVGAGALSEAMFASFFPA